MARDDRCAISAFLAVVANKQCCRQHVSGERIGECTSPNRRNSNFRKWALVSSIPKMRRSGSPANFTGARCFLPPSPKTGSLRPVDTAGRFSIFNGPVELKEKIVVLDIIVATADIDNRIAVARENLRGLIEQATAYSGAADDNLVAQRIADQEARLELLTKRREEVLQSTKSNARRRDMTKSRIKKNMEVIGADGVHIGTVDRITAGRIRLTKNDSGEGRHKGHHHYIDLGLVADIEGPTVRLSAVAATAVTFEEEKSGKPA
jgi:hypothetical protein